MKKNDLLFLCQYFYPEYISSAQLPFDTAKYLSDAGYSVGALVGYPKEYNSNKNIAMVENYENIKIQRLNYKQYSRKSTIGRLMNYFSFTLNVLKNMKYIKDYKAIIIYSNPPILPVVAYLAKKLYRTKIIFVSYDVYPELAIETDSIRENSIISKFMAKLNAKLFPLIDQVITLSDEMRIFLLNNRSNLSNKNITVIPNWDTTKFEGSPEVKNDKFKQLKDKKVISYFGNLGVPQDEQIIFGLLDAFRNREDIHFLFAGHGNKVSQLKNYVSQKSINNIDIFDFLTGQDFEDAMKITDFSIVSLKNNLNGLAVPSKTYTSLRAGIPIIAHLPRHSDTVNDILKYHAGVYAEQGKINELVEFIDCSTQKEMEEMKHNAKLLYKELYSKEKSLNKYLLVVNNLLKGEKNVQR